MQADPDPPGGGRCRTLFFLSRGDRLAARLKHMLFAWRFVREVGGTLVVGWPQRARSLYGTMAGEYYSPSLLFDLGQLYLERGTSDIVFVEGEGFASDRMTPFPPPEIAGAMPFALDRAYFEAGRGPFRSDNYYVRFADETKADVIAQVRDLYRQLPLSAAARKLVADAARATRSEPYVALHVRRGDIVDVLRAALPEMRAGELTPVALNYAMHLAKQTAPLDYYHDKVAQAVAERRTILFFSDTPALFAEVRARFPRGRLVDAAAIGRNAAYPLLKAFVDFTLIGRADHVIGTQTGFASVACMLGGARQVVVTARGDWDSFRRYLYDEVLGTPLPPAVADRIEAFIASEYDRYHQRARRAGDAID